MVSAFYALTPTDKYLGIKRVFETDKNHERKGL